MNSDVPLLAGRYRLGRVIGEGGFGTVYEGYDNATSSPVALKNLIEVEPERLLLFKREFRVLADCRHPNLIRYYELFEQDGRWYLAMERIAGVDLLTHVRGGEAMPVETSTRTVLVPNLIEAETTPPTRAHVPVTAVGRQAARERALDISPAGASEIARIRGMLAQLAAGLDHLHADNLIHRDITPRNIMVDRSGRVVILDFGLALRGPDANAGVGVGCVGTPKYMSPEQAGGEPATFASDWYSVGAILYELLTGVAPFVGSSYDIMRVKRTQAPLDPRLMGAHLPDDLCDLCLSLLATYPISRPQDPGLWLRRCALATDTPPKNPMPRRPRENPFVGRTDELALLERARTQAENQAKPTVLLVRGPSGMGKTALVNRFITALPPTPRLLLRSRCYQHESLPFKAIDGLADALGDHLRSLGEQQAERLLPDQVQYLARLFPSLRVVPAIARLTAEASVSTQDPHEMRRRGFQALRQLLGNLAANQRLVVTIDDMQWGDEDSINALVEVLAPPEPPALLLVMGARSDDDSSDALAQLRAGFARAGIAISEVAVGPLAADEGADLARRLLVDASRPAAETAAISAFCRESGGHPLYLRELVLASEHGQIGQQTTLRELISRRLNGLEPTARGLLECAVLAGRPRSLGLLHRALGEGENLAGAVHQLGGERLIRVRGSGGHDEVAIYHDKIAETALTLIPPERVRHLHRRLADALLAETDTEHEAEALSMHLLAAGDLEQGFHHGLRAADRAAASLAFDRAAALYRDMAVIIPPSGDRPGLLLKLADALANAGHGVEAARSYAEAGAANPDNAARLHAHQRAAGQYLRSGYIDQGIEVARQVLTDVDLRWHERSGSALLSLLARRVFLLLRGVKFKERDPAQTPVDIRLRMDALWSLGHGLGGVDTIRGAEFHARHLLMALKAGDPYRVGRGLAWEAILAAAEGGAGGKRRAKHLVAVGQSIAQRLGNDHAWGWCRAAEAYGYWCDGDWLRATECCTEAARLYREECHDITWELGSVYAWCWMPVLCYSGRLDELRQMSAMVEREFGQLGDLYTVVTMRTVVTPWLTLADGDPERAERESGEAVARWSQKHWHLQHLFDLMCRARVALYRGDGRAAADALDRDWPRYTAAMQNRLQVKRMFMLGLRGQAQLMAAMQGHEPALRLRTVEADARRLDREGMPWASAYAASLRAGLHAAAGRKQIASEAYLFVGEAFDKLGMPMHAAAARRRSGEISGAQDVVTAADGALSRLGIADPARFTATIVAGAAPLAV